ncbi:MAG: protein kinase [Polyangiaceae bacterium]
MATPNEEGPLRNGARFLDKYEIGGLIGRGGQAWVYRGKHIFTGREVAIKVVHSTYGVTQEMLDRGKSEARALGKLDSPNIVAMYDAGITDDGLFYIVMELLRGKTLRAVLAAHGRLEVEEVLKLAIQAAEAVQVAHDVQTIHRDLKPDNIFLTRDNRLKVLDFGIAKMLDEIGFTTRKHGVVGTLLYMSPEQAQGLMPLTPRSDIFALGVIMFEALFGKHPTVLIFEQDLAARNEPLRRGGLADLAQIQVNRKPPLLSELDARIPLYVAQVVQRAIAKVAKQRFASMADFVASMRVCLDTYQRDARASDRQRTARDLSLSESPKADSSPAPRQETAKQRDNGSTNGRPTTEAIKPVSERRLSEDKSASQVGLATAPIGTSLVAQSEPPPRPEQPPPEKHEGRGISGAVSATRKSKPSVAMPKPHTAALWRLKAATPPPVSIAPRNETPSPDRGSAAARTIRNTLIAGTLFGAAIGTAGAKAYFWGPARGGAFTVKATAAAQPSLAATPASPTPTDTTPSIAESSLPATASAAAVVALPSSATPSLLDSASTHALVHPSARTPLPQRPAKIDQRVRQLENDLKPAPSTKPASAEPAQPPVKPKGSIY